MARKKRPQTLQPLGGQGIWEHVFQALTRDRNKEYLMIDSSIVRAHAATGKGGRPTRLWGAPEEV
jgi:hypothetical protein